MAVKAAVLFGDVTHVANQTYNTANGTADNGVSHRFYQVLSSTPPPLFIDDLFSDHPECDGQQLTPE